MTEIEFLTPEPQTLAPADPVPVSRRDAVRAWAAPAAALLFALAALLAGLAPSHLVYRFRIGAGLGGDSYLPDGWGRLPKVNGGPNQHGLRYGIVVCVAAGLFVLAAALLLAYRARRAQERDRLRLPLSAAAAGLVGVALLVAVVGEVLLAMQSLRDNIKFELTDRQPLSRGALPSVHMSVGWMVWLVFIAAGCAVVALAATAVAARTPVPAPPADETPVIAEDDFADEPELI